MTTFQIVALLLGMASALCLAIYAAAGVIDTGIRAAADVLAEESHQHRLQRAALAREEIEWRRQARERQTILPPPITDNNRIAPDAAELIRRAGRR